MNTHAAYQYAQSHPEQAFAAQQQLKSLLDRSATDAVFRRKLLDDPRGAMTEFTGKEVPDTFDVAFVENDADVTIVLPDAIDGTAELGDEELESVAGGGFWLGVAASAVAAFCYEVVNDWQNNVAAFQEGYDAAQGS